MGWDCPHLPLAGCPGPGSDSLSVSVSALSASPAAFPGPALLWVSLLSTSDHPSPLFLSLSLFCFLPSVFYPLCFLASLSCRFSSVLVESSYFPPLSTPTKTKKRHSDTLNETRPRAPFSFSPSHHRRARFFVFFTTTFFVPKALRCILLHKIRLYILSCRPLPLVFYLLPVTCSRPKAHLLHLSYIHTTNDT